MKPAKITLRNGRDRARAAQWLDRCPLGYTLLFKPPVRSLDSNARMWAILDEIAAQKEWDGKKRTSDQWKDLFSACLQQQEIVRGLEGGLVAFGSHTSEFSPEQMSDMITLMEAWCAQNGVALTDPTQNPPRGNGEGERAEPPADGIGADGSARNISERQA